MSRKKECDCMELEDLREKRRRLMDSLGDLARFAWEEHLRGEDDPLYESDRVVEDIMSELDDRFLGNRRDYDLAIVQARREGRVDIKIMGIKLKRGSYLHRCLVTQTDLFEELMALPSFFSRRVISYSCSRCGAEFPYFNFPFMIQYKPPNQ